LEHRSQLVQMRKKIIYTGLWKRYLAAVETTKNISGITDPLNIAVLTGFILCDELNKAEQQLEEESIEVNRRTMKLISKLDKALKIYDDE